MTPVSEKKSEDQSKLQKHQAFTLKVVLIVNLVMFGLEFAYGWIAGSTALLSDSLDMFGDAVVYAFSLYVLDRSLRWKARASLLKGVIICALGLSVFAEVVRKMLAPELPEATTMGWVGALALGANLTCLYLLSRHRTDDINMHSTWECSRNDVASNVGVLLAAVLVRWTGSPWPDLLIGIAVGVVFMRSAAEVLRESISSL